MTRAIGETVKNFSRQKSPKTRRFPPPLSCNLVAGEGRGGGALIEKMAYNLVVAPPPSKIIFGDHYIRKLFLATTITPIALKMICPNRTNPQRFSLTPHFSAGCVIAFGQVRPTATLSLPIRAGRTSCCPIARLLLLEIIFG